MTAGGDSGPLSRLLAFDPDVLGLSCYMWDLHDFVRLAATLKARRPALTVVAGGPEVSSPSIARRLLAEASQISFVAMGEGEILFRRLMRYLARGEGSLGGMPGLAFRTPTGVVHLGPPAEAVGTLDEIPSPFLTLRPSPGACDCVLMETYRGCENQCHWCAWSRGRHREFSLDRILSELRALIAAGVPRVYMIDAVLGPGRARSEPILDLLIRAQDEGHAVPGFFVYPNPADFDDDMARKFRDANCSVSFGLQSTNPSALARANRHQDLGAFEVALGNANACFPRYEADLIFGLPGDTHDDFLASFNWLAGRMPPVIHCHRLRGLPGTPFYESAAEHGIVFQDSPPHLLISTETLPATDRWRLEQFSMGVYCFYNWATVTFRYLARTLEVDPAALVVTFVHWAARKGLVPSEGPLPNYFFVPPDHSFALVERFLLDMREGSDAAAARHQTLMAAIGFDRACSECYKGFFFNEPGRRNRPEPGSGADWGEVIVQPAEPPMRVVSIPAAVELAAGLASRPTGGPSPPADEDGQCEYLVHRRGYTRVGRLTARVLEVVARQESRTLGEIAAALKMDPSSLEQTAGEDPGVGAGGHSRGLRTAG